ncbi:hypothetical protein B0T20DRAFT_364476 [Sordaria brevicollis]|uniref:Uncharacterized protein n=1 Tax=Sordaria brevicollis TaxID=83679 RepID=A0AAE0NVV8_SORBR|nr:hypothetical protein B0T20DRAFT_364476 [Sordaria brevicollis]
MRCNLLLLLFASLVSFSLARYWFDDIDLKKDTNWLQPGVTTNEFSLYNIFIAPLHPPTLCPTISPIDEESYHSRGIDPAWGPIPIVWESCTSGPGPLPDREWKRLNKRIDNPLNCMRGIFKIKCFPNVDRANPGPVIYTLCAGKPELEFLGLLADVEAKKEVYRSVKDRDEEDQLCERMRLLGAQEYDGYFHMAPYGPMLVGSVKSETLCSRHEFNLYYGITLFGWPKTGGGVWVLKLAPKEVQALGGIERLRNEDNVDMGTQSKLIEELGGRFYADPMDCPKLKHLKGPKFAPAVVDERKGWGWR